jgi:rRNA maturation protein Nop10
MSNRWTFKTTCPGCGNDTSFVSVPHYETGESYKGDKKPCKRCAGFEKAEKNFKNGTGFGSGGCLILVVVLGNLLIWLFV